MPRTAREKDDYGIYYIKQQGIKERNLFNDDTDRDKFLSILTTSKEKNNFKLYAYCLTNPNEYHLLINANGSDISKIMKEINISYAMYVNYSSSIYKDRYKSTLVIDKENLISILSEIHELSKKINSIYNSYCFYNKENLSNTELLDKEDLESLADDDCFLLNTDCKNCIKTLDNGIGKFNEIAQSKNLTIEELLSNKSIRNDMIKQFRRNSTLSLKELGIIFGGLSESTICKILNNN